MILSSNCRGIKIFIEYGYADKIGVPLTLSGPINVLYSPKHINLGIQSRRCRKIIKHFRKHYYGRMLRVDHLFLLSEWAQL